MQYFLIYRQNTAAEICFDACDIQSEMIVIAENQEVEYCRAVRDLYLLKLLHLDAKQETNADITFFVKCTFGTKSLVTFFKTYLF